MPEDDEYKRQKLKDNFEQPLAKRNFWNRQRDVKGSISFKCFYLTEVCRNVKLKRTIIKCILNIKISIFNLSARAFFWVINWVPRLPIVDPEPPHYVVV